ncbi:MAG TPA: hypothetical protein VNO17_09520 [Actinomycetota bacterium]|nr:hypothetical protein [Actinomycetota bacterium]
MNPETVARLLAELEESVAALRKAFAEAHEFAWDPMRSGSVSAVAPRGAPSDPTFHAVIDPRRRRARGALRVAERRIRHARRELERAEEALGQIWLDERA